MAVREVNIKVNTEDDSFNVEGPGLSPRGVELVLLRALTEVQRKLQAEEIVKQLMAPKIAIANQHPLGPPPGGRG